VALGAEIPRVRAKSKANSRKFAHISVAKVDVKLGPKSKKNEKKTAVSGNSRAGRRHWIVAHPAGLAVGPFYVPKIQHGRRLYQIIGWP